MFGLIKVHETADEQIELAVAVVINPNGTRSPTRSGNSRRNGHIGESSVAIVPIQNDATVLRDVNIGETVGVVIAHRHAHSIAAARDTGLFGDVSEGSVTIIVIKHI